MANTEDLEGFSNEQQVQDYTDLKEENHKKFQDLMNQGVRIDPIQIVSIQLDVLLNLLGPEFVAQWGIMFENRVRDFLDAVEKEIPRMKLLAPTQPEQNLTIAR